MKNFLKLFVFAFCFIAMPYVVVSQTDNHHEHKGLNGETIDEFYLPLEFDADSLVGFDNEAVWVQAIMNSSEEWMQKIVVSSNLVELRYSKGLNSTYSNSKLLKAISHLNRLKIPTKFLV